MLKFLIIAGIVIAILIIWCFMENHIFVTNKYEIKDLKIPENFNGTRWLYLADLHNTGYGRYNVRLKKAIMKANPDYVLIGGDFLSRPDRTFDKAIDLLAFLSQKYPVYFANGNHETKMKNHGKMYHNVYQDFMEMAKGLPCEFLNDRSVDLERNGQKIVLCGLELEEDYFKRKNQKTLSADEITRHIGACKDNNYCILLAHSPNYFEAYADWGADLTLSGHNHGGMARIPFLCGVLSTQAELFPKYTKGIYQKGRKKMLVSAGLGSHTIKVRYFNLPELVLLTLKKEEQ